MRKKQSPKKRQKQPRVKARKGLQAETDITEGQAVASSESTQSGDTQGLSGAADANFESVKELTEEGQFLEAEVVDAVENSPTSDSGPVKTKQVPEDDVPEEYLDPENHEG